MGALDPAQIGVQLGARRQPLRHRPQGLEGEGGLLGQGQGHRPGEPVFKVQARAGHPRQVGGDGSPREHRQHPPRGGRTHGLRHPPECPAQTT